MQLQCCGANGPEDWARSVYNKKRRPKITPEIGIESHNSNMDDMDMISMDTFNIPSSCCVDPKSEKCRSATKSVSTSRRRFNPDDIFEEGCSAALTRFLEGHVIYLIGMAGGVLLVEIVGMIFSLCLCCALKRIDDFKAWFIRIELNSPKKTRKRRFFPTARFLRILSFIITTYLNASLYYINFWCHNYYYDLSLYILIIRKVWWW